MSAFIELVRVSLRYPGGDVLALAATDMNIGEGDFVAVVGPSLDHRLWLRRRSRSIEAAADGHGRRAVERCRGDYLR